jgi:hypothetical protein
MVDRSSSSIEGHEQSNKNVAEEVTQETVPESYQVSPGLLLEVKTSLTDTKLEVSTATGRDKR